MYPDPGWQKCPTKKRKWVLKRSAKVAATLQPGYKNMVWID
jgi:hypothetical protein